MPATASAVEAADEPFLPQPISVKKATKKLTKKFGHAPTEAEVEAYISKKLAKDRSAMATANLATPAAVACATAARKEAARGGDGGGGSAAVDSESWVDSVGEPPRKGQIPDGKGGWRWPRRETPTGNGTILLFYGYVVPSWTYEEHDAAMEFARESLTRNGCTGRLRCAAEGFNGTLTGPHDGIRAFTRELAEWAPQHFGKTDFKYVDNLPDHVMEKELKVFPVSELVTYGFGRNAAADIRAGGKHLKPSEYHEAMSHPNAIMIDVRNFNESIIGKFAPPNIPVLDPQMRRSTEFPKWVDDNLPKLQGKKVLMYCTGGIRCERASAYLVEKGLTDVNQLEGGIHRYLEEYVEDGGHWIGSNYTFDKRFSHGAKNAQVIGKCVLCGVPWERYAARKKCKWCRMEVLVCRTCDRAAKAKGEKKVPIDKERLVCPLCVDPKTRRFNNYGVQG